MEEALEELPASGLLGDLRSRLAGLILSRGYEYRAEPFQLSKAGLSHDYVDGKRAIAKGEYLELVGEAITELARARKVTFDAVGGLTLGADPIAVAVAIRNDAYWFSVRKEAKTHGMRKRIEGAELAPGTTILLVDDVVTSGGSIIDALDAIQSVQADVVLATTLIDRGNIASKVLAARGLAYEPLLTFADIGIDPVEVAGIP